MELQELPSLAASSIAADKRATHTIPSHQVAASLVRDMFAPPLALAGVGARCLGHFSGKGFVGEPFARKRFVGGPSGGGLLSNAHLSLDRLAWRSCSAVRGARRLRAMVRRSRLSATKAPLLESRDQLIERPFDHDRKISAGIRVAQQIASQLELGLLFGAQRELQSVTSRRQWLERG